MKRGGTNYQKQKQGCKGRKLCLTCSMVHCLVWAWVGRNAADARRVKAQFLIHVARVTGVPGGMTAEGAW